MSDNLLAGVSPKLLNGSTHNGSMWVTPARTSTDNSPTYYLEWPLSQSALTANQTYRVAMSTLGNGSSENITAHLTYKDAAGNTNAVDTAIHYRTSWARSESTFVVPSGMTPISLSICKWGKHPAVSISNPVLTMGTAPVVLAISSSTLAWSAGILATVRYYQLAAPTAATPTVPTSSSSLGSWTETEPTADVTKVLWTCNRTIYADGTESWSKASKSTSYEAAKDAKSTANTAKSNASAAQSAANAAQSTANGAKSAASAAQHTADSAAKQANLYSISGDRPGGMPKWIHLGTLTSNGDASNTTIAVKFGNGYNGSASQNSALTITIKDGWQTTQSATDACGVSVMRENCDDALVDVLAQSATVYDVWVYAPWNYSNGDYSISGSYAAWKHSGATQKNEPATSDTQVKQNVAYRLADATKAQKMAVENSSSIRKLSDRITSEVTTRTKTDTMVTEVSSRLIQTSDSFSVSISRLSETDKKVNSWFDFDSDSSGNPQLKMGSSTSPVIGTYTNTGMAYKSRSGATLMELDASSQSSTLPHMHADDVSIGNWQWMPTQNGTHFTLKWIGG